MKGNETRRIVAIFASFCVARVCQRQLGFLVLFVDIFLPVLLLHFAPPRPSPSSLLLSSTKDGEVLGLTPSNWGHGAAEVPSTFSSLCLAFISAAPMWVAAYFCYILLPLAVGLQ